MPRWRKRRATSVPDAELAVLKVLWEKGEARIREITEVLYPRGDTSHYATVQKLLERLRERDCVARRRVGRAHVFRATVQRADLIRDHLQSGADKLCEGSLTPFLTQLVDAKRLKPDEIAALRRLVDELEPEGER